MKLDQIAYYAHDAVQAANLKSSFGLIDEKWVTDVAKGNVRVFEEDGGYEDGRSTGLLQFNYSLGIELEVLTYLDGIHWHQNKPEFRARLPFLSHIGFHMEPGEQVPAELKLRGGKIAQFMATTSHTNEYVNSKERTYRYEIYRMPSGPDRKFIWRIEE